MPAMSAQLVKYEAARQALSEAHRVDEVKDIRDKALAMATYARQAKDRDLITWATEIKLRAERRAGELLREMEKNQGGKPETVNPKPVASPDRLDKAPTLRSLGVTKQQSSDWQKLAKIPEKEFERRLGDAVRGDKVPTTASVLRSVPRAEPSRASSVSRKPARKDSPLTQALEEGRAWMAKWRFISALAPVFDALTALLESQREASA
jgi:hypothetical protein